MTSTEAIVAGQVLSYLEMCTVEGASLQRGMNFRLGGFYSVLLMSRRPNAPYADRIEDDGRVLIYEGHDMPRQPGAPDPKQHDQPLTTPTGAPTQNGLFLRAARAFVENGTGPEVVKVYEKIRQGIWVFNGVFRLVDGWTESSANRTVVKLRLELTGERIEGRRPVIPADGAPRVIPGDVKLAVWKRDKGRCIKCDSDENLHFDHVIPFSMGGSSLVAANIQLLCALHNLRKGASLTG